MIDRKFTRSRYVHQHKYHQINKGQFLHGKRIIPVYHKKSHSHCKDHRDHSQTIKRTEYKAYGTKYLTENGIRVRYMHSDIGAMERMEIIRDLRMAKFDVLIGINLLREGLDLPEVSLIAILDADKEGFLRSETSLIQTIGRAARNAEGRVLLYADKITPAMRAAMDETARRRQIQDDYNKAHGIVPKTIVKSVRDLIEISATPTPERAGKSGVKMTKQELQRQIEKLEKSMREAARMMEYEYAAVLRDEIIRLRGEVNQVK